MLNSLILANEQTSNWLTPVWLVALGLVGGFLVFALIWSAVFFLSRIPVINRLHESPRTRITLGLVLAVAIFGLGMWIGSRAGWWQTEDPWAVAANGKETVEESPADASGSLLLAGILLAVGSAIVGFGLVAVSSFRRREEILRAPTEGMFYWLNWLCGGAAAFVLLGLALWWTGGLEIFTIVDNPRDFFGSLTRLPFTGVFEKQFEIAVSSEGDAGTPIAIAFDGRECQWIQFFSDQPLDIAAEPITPDLPVRKFFSNVMGKNAPWLMQVYGEDASPIPRGPVKQFFVVNQGDGPALLQIRWRTQPEVVQVIVIPLLAIFVAGLYTLGLLLEALAPKISAVSLATFKTEVSQPIFLILILFGVLFILASVFIPYFSFGEDIKMYQDAGLTVIRVLGIFLAIWAASKSIAEEIEGRTALTVLSKPIGRVQFVVGKFLGIAMAVGLLILLLGLWFTIWTSYKPIYDTVETAERLFDWKVCFAYVVANFPALMLIFMECVLFVSISVAISTRVGILPNFLICFAIYVLGHLTSSIVASKEVGSIEQVVFVGQVISIIFPVLDHFDASTAIMTSSVVPIIYLGWATLYTLLYGTIMLLLSLILFQDRDLA